MFETRYEFLKTNTVYDEDTIGCYLSIYGNSRLCSGMQNCGCKKLKQCEAMYSLEKGKQNGKTK